MTCPKPYDLDIPGWMFEQDLEILSLLSSLVRPGGKIIELGSWLGRSTTALWRNKLSSVTLEVIDKFSYDGIYSNMRMKTINGNRSRALLAQKIAASAGSWLPAFKDCVDEALFNDIQIHVSSTDDFSITHKYDLVFIDAGHEEEQVLRDIIKFSTDDNFIVGDDFNKANEGVSHALMKIGHMLGRTIIIPGSTKLWIMPPVTGYWDSQFGKIYSGIKDIGMKYRINK